MTSSTAREEASTRSSNRRARGLTRIDSGAPMSSATARRLKSSTEAAETVPRRGCLTNTLPRATRAGHKSFPLRLLFGKLPVNKAGR
jgi:hypothetical protein